MTKIFNPEIKPDLKCIGAQPTTITRKDGKEEDFSAYIVNSPVVRRDIFKTIGAIPELLKVLEAARKVINSIPHSIQENKAIKALEAAIENIDEKHGKEVG